MYYMTDTAVKAAIRAIQCDNPKLRAETEGLVAISKNAQERRAHDSGYIDLRLRIQDKQHDGKIGLYVWQMDCDCASFDSLTVLDADWYTVVKEIIQVYDWAEGQVSWGLRDPREAKDFRSTSRDHALEAFEEGHPHVVYT